MADEPQPPASAPSAAGADPSRAGATGADPTIPADQDYLFRARIAATEFILGNWKYGAYALGGMLVVMLVWGTYSDWRHGVREEQFGAIAAIDHKMPTYGQEAAYGLAPKDDPADVGRKANLEEGARRYAAAAQAASGSAAVVAWLKSADAWERAQNPDEARKAIEAASALGAGDLPGFVADTAWVAALIDQGRGADAQAKLAEMGERYTGLYAERALLQLGNLQIEAGEADKARATVETLKKRFPSPKSATEVDALAARVGA